MPRSWSRERPVPPLSAHLLKAASIPYSILCFYKESSLEIIVLPPPVCFIPFLPAPHVRPLDQRPCLCYSVSSDLQPGRQDSRASTAVLNKRMDRAAAPPLQGHRPGWEDPTLGGGVERHFQSPLLWTRPEFKRAAERLLGWRVFLARLEFGKRGWH